MFVGIDVSPQMQFLWGLTKREREHKRSKWNGSSKNNRNLPRPEDTLASVRFFPIPPPCLDESMHVASGTERRAQDLPRIDQITYQFSS